MHRFLVTLTALCAAASLTGGAAASDLVDRNASAVRLAVSKNGKRALVTYRSAGRLRRVLVFGALNALHPSTTQRQVRFQIDYTGGWETTGRVVWPRFGKRCGRYDGPVLAFVVAACKAPDGSYWALQSWQSDLPHRGYPAWKPSQDDWELHISHWRGPVAELQVWTDWAFGGQAHDLFGKLTYRGVPVHGFRTAGAGGPADGYGRSLYIDTHNSAYGAGWKRETSVVFRNPSGAFCYSFWPTHDRSLPGAPHRPAGKGDRYRITVQGPGVTPDVAWEGPGLHEYDAGNPADVAYEQRMNRLLDEVTAPDRFCKTQH
ncbi:MAG: hypothetical protein QOE36_2532 [Gaiellaceae bacterium]|nr:hypothetical protein [Gaiellaceae bacterium]